MEAEEGLVGKNNLQGNKYAGIHLFQHDDQSQEENHKKTKDRSAEEHNAHDTWAREECTLSFPFPHLFRESNMKRWLSIKLHRKEEGETDDGDSKSGFSATV